MVKLIVLIASIVLVFPFVFLVLGAIVHVNDGYSFESSTLGKLVS